ncbi:MAG: ATP-dependent DNA helicase RecG [Candidatus Kapaibacteriales bacterium]
MYYPLKGKPKPIQFIKGVGPSRAKAFEKENIFTDVDLLFYFPRAYISRSSLQPLKKILLRLLKGKSFQITTDFQLEVKEELTVIGKVIEKKIQNYRRTRKFLIVKIADFDGSIAKIIFWQYVEYYYGSFNVGEYVVVQGVPELDKYNSIVFTHPEFEILDTFEERNFLEGSILPIYSIPTSFKNSKINNKILRKIIGNAIESGLKILEDYLPHSFLERYKIPQLKKSIHKIHFPNEINSIPNLLFRFKFDEVFIFELVLYQLRLYTRDFQTAPIFEPNYTLLKKFQDSLSFRLTDDQQKAIKEIFSDLALGKPMNRLLQGDVGSGKTIVAIYSLLLCVENGYQALIIAPTEILAEQHYLMLINLLRNLPIRIELLVGSLSEKKKMHIYANIANGLANIIVGTHALFESKVKYNSLGMIVIDEQHRFGVEQRAKLRKLAIDSLGAKNAPHILVMSATPIPRTLTLTLYGDLDISIIREMPKGRKPIITRIISESELPNLYNFVREEVRNGRQVYFVYPLVEKSDKSDYKSAIEHYDILQNQIFPDLRCGLLYGSMPWKEKEKTMSSFKSKSYDILVSTTVIEVGIDVPNATIIVIENAERFGLAQLHQLRGRVGRSELQSFCFLVTKDKLYSPLKKDCFFSPEDKISIARLKAMESTNDGFEIAEIDLKLRGPGDIMGTQQSGLPPFKYLNIVTDGEIIAKARQITMELFSNDPELQSLPKLKSYINKIVETNKYFGIG